VTIAKRPSDEAGHPTHKSVSTKSRSEIFFADELDKQRDSRIEKLPVGQINCRNNGHVVAMSGGGEAIFVVPALSRDPYRVMSRFGDAVRRSVATTKA
jgi:hypothetical protein